MGKTTIIHLLISLLIQTYFFKSTLALNFTCTSFPCGDLLFSGGARIESGAILLTNSTAFYAVGRAFYPSPIPFRPSPGANRIFPFSTYFVFSITPPPPQGILLPGHGMSFVVAPAPGIEGASPAKRLGLTNSSNDGNLTNHLFAIEFDVFQNLELNDISYSHVGVDVNSVKSLVAKEAGYWRGDGGNKSFKKLKLNNGDKYRVWIDYVGGRLTVTMAPLKAAKPEKALIEVDVDLSAVFLDDMYAGFIGANGKLVESHEVHSWSLMVPPAGSKKMEMLGGGATDCVVDCD